MSVDSQNTDTPMADRLRKRPPRKKQLLAIGGVMLAAAIGTFVLDYFGQTVPLSNLPEGLAAAQDVSYGPHPAQSLDIVYHETDGPHPAIVMLHEGGWTEGDKASYHPEMIAWSARGYVTVSVNYRLAGQARFPAQIEDARSAVRWLRANADKYGADSEAIGITGWSAGAHLAMLVALADETAAWKTDGPHAEHSCRVQAAVCVSGVYDLLPEDRQRWQSYDDDPSVIALLGGRATQREELARQASPVRYLSPDDPPVLVLHGEDDRVIDVQQARDFAAALKRNGRNDQVLIHPGDHGSHVFPTTPVERTAVREFFERHLQKASRQR